MSKTPIDYGIQQTAGESYLYFGVEKGVISGSKRFGGYFFPKKSFLNLQINVDGLPLFKSSRLQIWPVLGQITGVLPLYLSCVVQKTLALFPLKEILAAPPVAMDSVLLNMIRFYSNAGG